MMANSDVDSWYDWKRNDFGEQLHLSKTETSKDYGLDTNRYDPITYKDSKKESPRVNGWIRSHRKPTNSQSSSDVRFVNPAIYVESFKKEDKNQASIIVNGKSEDLETTHNGRIQADCGDSNRVHTLLSQLSLKDELPMSSVSCSGDQNSTQATYRCHSVNSSITTASSVEFSVASSNISSRRATQVQRRCKIEDIPIADGKDGSYSARQFEPVVQRYTVNGQRVVQVCTTSTSCNNIPKQLASGPALAKKVAHDEWVRKKELRKKKEEESVEKSKREEAERLAREKEEREWKERENFLRWNEKKKREDEEKKAAIDKEIKLQKRLKEVEDKAAVAKSIYLRQWCLKKKEEQKARQKKQQLEQKQVDEDRKKRLEESTKAYEKWREVSKNKPRPATQGLLPHQKAKPAFVNPIPWQSIIDIDPDDTQEEELCNRKLKPSQFKTLNGRYTKPWE